MGQNFFETHFALLPYIIKCRICLTVFMSNHMHFNDNSNVNASQGKVKVTDLLSRLNEEKKIEKKRNLALGVAAVTAVTVFGIILTI